MTKRILIAWALAMPAALVAQPPAEEQQPSAQGVVRKNLAPVSTDLLRVKLPRPVERTLKNGLKVVILENHRAPMVHLDLILPASTLNDPAELPGVAEATADLLDQGTSTRTSRRIAEQLSEMAASLSVNAEWGTPSTHVRASAMTENLDALIEIASDVLLNASFPQDEFDKWKQRKLSRLKQQRANPTFLGGERMAGVLYAGDARARISATEASVAKMTRDDLLAFRKRYYTPGNSLLGVTGDVTPGEIVAKLEKALGAWKPGVAPAPAPPAKAPVAEKKVYLVNRPGSVQTYLVLGNHAIDRLSPDYIVCSALNQILGQGPASRLFINLREEKGYTYGVRSAFRAGKFLDEFTASASVRTGVTTKALDEFLKEFRRIREEAVSKEDLDNAKRAIIGRFALSLESQTETLDRVLSLREYGLPADYWDTLPAKVMAVTAEDVRRAARKYVPLGNVQIVAVGAGDKLRDELKAYGPVEEYTTDGKKVE